MASGFSLKDQLFNADSLGDLAAEYSAAISGFDGPGFHAEAMAGLEGRGLLERLDWIADCLEPRLATDFPQMAAQIEAAMPPELDPTLTDDDFGRFIHAVPGILAVRHGLEHHRDRALDLLHAATKRFSMEAYIRPFLNRWPDETMARLWQWSGDENYHVRRLVSEGTRPRLPWAARIDLDPLAPLPLLDALHADQTRYVTRSVANHLNDIAKIDPDAVLNRLAKWRGEALQDSRELGWMTRHSLRTLIKQGNVGALDLLGYRADAPVAATRFVLSDAAVRAGDQVGMSLDLAADAETPVLVDYRVTFSRPTGRPGEKVFKWKQGVVTPDGGLSLQKRHRFKADATTFRLYPGPHAIEVLVNGRVVARADFDLLAAL